ncbi:MAG: DUF262 domain-containing protein [Methanocorpusculum sp.]|nr:DUF262 domain-containing protein [Methanocorpusculum sp.]
MAYKSPLTIAEVIKAISASWYILPSIHREFVWGTTQIERLFDSLMQRYPIRAFLFCKITKDHYGDYDLYRFLDHYHRHVIYWRCHKILDERNHFYRRLQSKTM